MSKKTAEESKSPILEGLTLREKVRRLILANGGLVINPGEAEIVDADKLRSDNPFLVFRLPKGLTPAQEQLLEAQGRAEPAPRLNPEPVSRGPHFQEPMARGEDQKMRQTGDDWD